MPVKDMSTNGNEYDWDNMENLMIKDHNNKLWNSYDSGPGKDLPKQFATSNKGDRSHCGIFLNAVHPKLEDNGIRNLCNKYGQVKEVKRFSRRHDNFNNAIVEFANVADAENAIYNINKLCFKVDGKVMRASFKKSQEKPNEERPPQFKTVHADNVYDLPLATPSPIIRDFDDGRENIVLKTIGSRCASHSNSPQSTTKMQIVGSFDEDTQPLVHNEVELTVPNQCKNCHSPTLKFCKGCRDPFCSMYCLKEYNLNECGCSCVSSHTAEVNVKKLNRAAAGRGAKLLSPRVISPTSRSISSPASDTKSVGKWKQRLLFREQCEKDQKYDAAVRVEPCDMPKNNELVTITSVVSHKYVFLRSVERDDKYLKYLNDVVEYAKTAPPLNGTPKKGDIVLAEYEGHYHRAHVARIRNNDAVIAFLELGDVQIKPINGMKQISDELKNAKQFVFQASLTDMDMSLKSDTCLIYLHKLMEKSTQLKFIAKDVDLGPEDVRCELVVSATNESVNGKLRALNNIKPDQPVMQADIPTEPFDVRANEVVVIDNSLTEVGLVTVATAQHVSDMFQMHKRIQEYCKDDYESPYMPRHDEICLAKCGDQWYRVKLERSFGDMNPVMFFIDFCLYNKVNNDNMRRMPSEFCYLQYSVVAEIGGITDGIDESKLCEKFPPWSKLSVAKIEYVNVNPEELRFFFNALDFTDILRVPKNSNSLGKNRRQQIERVMKSLNSGANGGQ